MGDGEKKDEGPNRIMVYLRIRPAKKGEIAPPETNYLMETQPDNKTVILEGGQKSYNFDWVFDGDGVKQQDIYEKVAVPVIDNIFKGFWGTMMVYGQTGTGKSFTMCNFSMTNRGIIPLTMDGIFEKIAADPDRVYTVCFSFIQIYLDRLQDLFNPNDKNELKMTRDKDGVAFPGIVERTCGDYAAFQEQYDDGHQYRVITATKMNPESSRGHAALFMQIKSVPKNDPSGENRNGKLFMIDLAGYERFSKTGVQEGLMKEEAKTINASLLSLGNCVQALAEKSEHVPWRNAKLTRMLEDAIGGKAKCSIILTAGPSNEHLHETVGTLYFGFRAMSVKTNAKLQVNIDYKKLAAKLQELLNAAEGKISDLEAAAARRQLEREEGEGRMEEEKALMVQRQEEAMKKLLAEGADATKIQDLIKANKLEAEMLEDQHLSTRQAMEEKMEAEVAEERKRVAEANEADREGAVAGMSKDVAVLRRDLAAMKEELGIWKTKAKEAEAEARRLMSELTDAKVKLAAGGGMEGGDGKPFSNAEMKKEVERRVETVREMLEETFELRLQEVEEPLQEEVTRYKALYEKLRSGADSELQAQKDALETMYEQEIAEIKKACEETQEKLKKNHMTIKKSYQAQKEELQAENDRLMMQLAAGGGGGAAPSGEPGSPSRPGVPSLAEVMIMKKQSERKVEEIAQQLADVKADLDYVQTEKAALERSLKEYAAKPGEERMNPGQVRKLRDDHDKLLKEKAELETELFKLKASQALTGPQTLANDDDEEQIDDLDVKEDMCGDFAGMTVFAQKLLKVPNFQGTQKVNAAHDHVLSTLTTDLDEYRRAQRIKLVFFGPPGCGKTSAIKCLITGSAPLIKAAPEVAPTLHPAIQSGSVDDTNTPKGNLHKLYVKFEDVAETAGAKGGMLSVLGLGSTGVPDPAKVYVDVIDLPGSQGWWRGMPAQMLGGKNTTYVVTYNMAQPFDAIKDDISAQLMAIQASASRNYSRALGGDTPRVAVLLLGTHRDGVREGATAGMKDPAVHSFLNRITASLGDTFFKLRGADSYGLVILGNFAISCKDWTVTSAKGARAPQTFRDLFQWMVNVSSQLYDQRPNAMLPSGSEGGSHASFVLGEEQLDRPQERTSQLQPHEKRLRKGIITLLTTLHREQKVRWLMHDKELRAMVAEHLGVDPNLASSISATNFVVRELLVRGMICFLPYHIYEPKYAAKHKDDIPPDVTPQPREGVIVIDPLRLLMIYSAFIAPTCAAKVPNTLPQLKDKTAMLFDYPAFLKMDPSWQHGIITANHLQVTSARFLPLTASDVKLLMEVLCVLGVGIGLKQEAAMLAPCHFSTPMPVPIADYLSYLVSNHGDGVGRKYVLNCCPDTVFSRLQTMLVPFSHAPTNEPQHTSLNFCDGSFLLLDKSRLKYGIFGSKAVKDAVMQAQLPVRGIMKVEGTNLYVALTARGASSAAMTAAVKPILAAIHHQILVLCRREFRGVTASYQDMTIAGCDTKRQKLATGVASILGRFGCTPEEIQAQIGIVGNMADPKAAELENALAALPAALKAE